MDHVSMRLILGVLWVAAACGSQNNLSGDDSGTVDALAGSGSGSGSGHVPMVDTVTCQTHTFTITAADGSRSVSETKFALVSRIDPAADIIVEQCDLSYVSITGSVS